MNDAINEWTAPPVGASIALPAPVPTSTGSEATKIEQSRAVAEVYAAVASAQAIPRDIRRSRQLMRASMGTYDLAAVSFYRYTRSGKTIDGQTVAFARSLAWCFGNFRSGMTQLSRDDVLGRSEMMAWAWDLEQNVWRDSKFISPHRSYFGDGRELDSDRDIYESNTSQAARRERSLILALLPTQFVEEATTLARETLARGPRDDESIEDRRQAAAVAFDQIGVTTEQIETRLGRPFDRWDGYDLAELTILRGSLTRRETTIADEFPTLVALSDLPSAAGPSPKPETPTQTSGSPQDGPRDAEMGDRDPNPDPPLSGAVGPSEGEDVDDSPITEDELRAALKGTKPGERILIRDGQAKARELAEQLNRPGSFGTMEEIAADQDVAIALINWIADTRAGR